MIIFIKFTLFVFIYEFYSRIKYFITTFFFTRKIEDGESFILIKIVSLRVIITCMLIKFHEKNGIKSTHSKKMNDIICTTQLSFVSTLTLYIPVIN